MSQFIYFYIVNPLIKYCRYAAAAAALLQSCPTLCDPIDGSPPGFPSLGFSRQEHWSGLPFPSPMHEREKWKWSRSVVSDSVRPHGLQPTRLLHPWDFPGKSTGVGCHCLLQGTKVAEMEKQNRTTLTMVPALRICYQVRKRCELAVVTPRDRSSDGEVSSEWWVPRVPLLLGKSSWNLSGPGHIWDVWDQGFLFL